MLLWCRRVSGGVLQSRITKITTNECNAEADWLVFDKTLQLFLVVHPLNV